MKAWLLLVASFLLWPGCSSQNECEEPDEIDFGKIVSAEKAKYLENDRVQYRCDPSCVLEGPEWIQCNGQEWTPHPPKCLAPCSISRQRLAAKNLFVFGGLRKARLIQSNQSLQFQCNEGYVLVPPSVRKCVGGYMDFPLCISETGKNCEDPPSIENGDITTLAEQQYRSGSSVEFRCQKDYVMEGQKRSFCNDGTWTEVPNCVKKHCDSVGIENGRMENRVEQFPKSEGEQSWFFCYNGFLPKSKERGWQRVTCTNSRFEPEPKCFKQCDPSERFDHGRFINNARSKYIEGDNITLACDMGYSPANQQSTSTCTKNGWSPAPSCAVPEGGCGQPPAVDNGDIGETLKKTYVQSESVTYRCKKLYRMEGSARVTCQNGHWSQTPECIDIEGKCGRPPPVENGDIVDRPKRIYLQSDSVIYQCQSFYTMEGSPSVTCQNGRWSQTPTCRVACTASAEDMSLHNIRLKWTNKDKIYSADGNVVEFKCIQGYKPHPNTGSFRVYCVDGKFDYPHCIPI